MVATVKFSEFLVGGNQQAGDIVVGLRDGKNYQFNAGGSGGGVTKTISQPGNSFVVGNWVRIDPVTSLYVLAQADNAQDAEVIGVIVQIVTPADTFVLQQAGPVDSSLGVFSGLTAGTVYFLSTIANGAMTPNDALINGQVSRPVFVADGDASGWVVPYRGLIVGQAGPGGSGGSDTNIVVINQTGHGLVPGDIVRLSGSITYVKAKADTFANSQAVGVVIEVINPNQFVLQTEGYYTNSPGSNTGPFSLDDSGMPLVASTVYYLSPTVAGKLTSTNPIPVPLAFTDVVSKPIYVSEQIWNTTGTNAGYILEQRPIDFSMQEGNSYKPIPTNLIVWDFQNNPSQFNGLTILPKAVGANKSYYTYDQTILFQTVNSGFTTQPGIIHSMTVVCNVGGQFALIQYLDQASLRLFAQLPICVNLGLASTVGGLTGTVSLWTTSDANLPNVNTGTNNSLVATMDATGYPTALNGSWTEISRGSLGNATFNVPLAGTLVPNLNGWQGNPVNIDVATYFAIVVGFSPMAPTDLIDINWITLQNGIISTLPSPQSEEQALIGAERFYEKSYNETDIPGTITNSGVLTAKMGQSIPSGGGNTIQARYAAFGFPLHSQKRPGSANPITTLYSPVTGAANMVRLYMVQAGVVKVSQDVSIANWTQVSFGAKSVLYTPVTTISAIGFNSSSATETCDCYIEFHYTTDMRLGIVN